MIETRRNILIFSDDWGRHPSSCQHLARRLLRRHRVLWVNTIGMRALSSVPDRSRGFEVRQWGRKSATETTSLPRIWKSSIENVADANKIRPPSCRLLTRQLLLCLQECIHLRGHYHVPCRHLVVAAWVYYWSMISAPGLDSIRPPWIGSNAISWPASSVAWP